MVEPQPSKLMMRVRSSLPAPTVVRSGEKINNAHIAQLVEHFLGKEEVTGSNPVMSSIILVQSCKLRAGLILEARPPG